MVHKLLGDMVAKLWGVAWSEACPKPSEPVPVPQMRWPPPLALTADLDQFASCLAPLTEYDVLTSKHDHRVQMSGDWRVFEDVPGKPGWISLKSGSQLTFPLKL